MTDNLTEEQIAARFKNRRRMAWCSFLLLTVSGIGLIAWGAGSDAAAERINVMFPLLTLVVGTYVSIILAYYGAAAYEHGKHS